MRYAALALVTLGACSPKPPEPPTPPEPAARAVAQSCARSPRPDDATAYKANFGTDAGMHGLWDPAAFSTICSHEVWSSQFIDDANIEKNIAKGSFVPIYVHSDGGPAIELRIGTVASPAKYRAPGKTRIARRSDPYLFVSSGAISVSGIEYIGGNPGQKAHTLRLPAGRWTVVILEVEPLPAAPQDMIDMLPNFVALINPERRAAIVYSHSVETFSEEEPASDPNRDPPAQVHQHGRQPAVLSRRHGL